MDLDTNMGGKQDDYKSKKALINVYNGFNGLCRSCSFTCQCISNASHGSDGKVKGSFTSSVYDYAKDYIKRSNYDDTYKCGLNLVKAMLDYGTVVQTYFGINIDKPDRSEIIF